MHRLVRRVPVISTACVPMLAVLLLGGCREDLIGATPVDTDADPTVVDTTVDLQSGDSVDADGPAEVDPDAAGDAEQALPETEGAQSAVQQRPATDGGSAGRRSQLPEGGSPRTSPGEAGPPRDAPSSTPEPSPTTAPGAGRNADRAAPGGGFESASPRQTGPRPPAGGGERADRGDRGAGLFERQDANGDGLLSRNEIPEQVRERIMAADANGDGALSREELREAMPRGPRAPGGEEVSPEERRARMMERLDANGDGKLQVSELPERMRERMAQADVNHDGVLSDQEMEALGESWRERRGDGAGGFSGRPRRGGDQD